MRIAVVCTDQGVRVPGAKGASLHLAAISSAFAALGHEVLLIGVAGHGCPPRGVGTLLFRHPGRATGLERERRKLALVDHVAEAASEPLRAFAPALLYERLSLFGTAGVALAESVGATHVVEVNALLAEEEATWRELHLADLATRREREVLGACSIRVCVSDELARRVEQAVPGPATVVVPNGVDGGLFARAVDRAEARRSLGLPAVGAVIGFAGSLRPWHGLSTAIAALVGLPGVELAVAGTGAEEAQLRAEARSLGVDRRVRWLGPLPHPRMPEFLAALDVALAPYPRLEEFSFSPLKLFEYLAAGVPVVASDIGQVRQTLGDGRWGELVPPSDPAALAAAVHTLLADPAPARQRAAAGRANALVEHTWERRAAQILASARTSAEVG